MQVKLTINTEFDLDVSLLLGEDEDREALCGVMLHLNNIADNELHKFYLSMEDFQKVLKTFNLASNIIKELK